MAFTLPHTPGQHMANEESDMPRQDTPPRRIRPSIPAALVAALALGSGGVAAPAGAQDAWFEGSQARVALSASLRSLGERVAATSCRTGLTASAGAERDDVAAVFDVVVAGLREGDASLGVPSAETHPRLIRRLDAVHGAWAPVRTAAKRVETKPKGLAAIAGISAAHDELMEATEALLTDVSGQYSNPQELLQVDALALNFLERQKMLLARMDRMVCALHAGLADLGTAEGLKVAVDLFDVSLVALRDGFPMAGIDPPRTEVLKATLVESHARWNEARAVLDRVAGGAPVDAALTEEVAALTRALSADMHNAITLTKISAPGQAGVYRTPLTAYAETELAAMLTDPALIEAIRAQNAAHADLAQGEIDALDLTWRAEAKAGGGALVDDLMSRPVSRWLADRQLDSAGFITEAFVMDDKGLNVAQSAVTSDYWQGDEAKWQETYAAEDGGLHISEVEFDDSTGFYQTQASMPILDPETGEKIGAVTFGINVQRLM